ncbi:unnamed protein product [marine sediment metagenome]|uniref:Uncharacterized protein n=1 Tax=marine sediment metagenome TaxID=412755 RepID=X1U7L0_9ZZZZ
MGMTLDEAIALSSSLRESDNLKYHPDLRAATQLGIEALKRIGVGRRTGRFSWGDSLPGETTDMPRSLTDPEFHLGSPVKEK